MPENDHASYLNPILSRYRYQATHLMQILREAQECYDYLHPDAIDYLTAELRIPRTKIEGVASFYSFFYLRSRGRYRVLFSDNITDRMLGNVALMKRMCNQLWVEPGKVSEDGLVSIDLTSCTGMCDQGPALLVNNIAITRLDTGRVDEICDLIREQVPLAQWPQEFFRVTDNIRRKDILLDDSFISGAALAAALIRGPEALLAEVQVSNLRGRGGAGFATGVKWESCRNAPGEAHYVVCNADEGEPGTFKDRVLLTSYADKVFEGMALCGFVIGARKGMLYLRGEYHYLLQHLNAVLERRRQQKLLGSGILGQTGFDFDIEIHLGAGAYICGEESALIESLEGKRGTPRNRPPFPVTHGYLNQPTVVNNVETFAATCHIAQKGGAWYAGIGTGKSAGSKILSVSGDCERPGIYEYPFGVSVQRVLEDCGAKDTQAVQVSGPSGITVAAHEFGRRIAFEDLPTAGAFMVFDATRDMFEVARNFVHFFAHESCGFCTPCRVGTSLLKNLMDKLHNGHGSPYDFTEIERLNQILLSMSHCGLGHTACNPVLDTIAKFRPAYEQRLQQLEFTPAFNLDWSLQAARRMTGRDDSGAHMHDRQEPR
ncbi:MAG TPA: NAD(P)H-dependent oxidoreductase subunit E [Novimethylophilus sp.]|uniref:NAD(P)H-dependent oxidoreductase subunit E n=1 Tax=Novimethylophilus sp. TaxID=2137426 RepID=UPI002F3FBE3A